MLNNFNNLGTTISPPTTTENPDVNKTAAAASVDLYDTNRFKFEELPQTDQETEKYLANVKKYAFWCDPFDWESGKKVVLLSTCDYETEEQRLVIFAIEE